jgi:hypothetical protein
MIVQPALQYITTMLVIMFVSYMLYESTILDEDENIDEYDHDEWNTSFNQLMFCCLLLVGGWNIIGYFG